MDKEISSYSIYKSLEKSIEDRIKYLKEKLDKNVEKLKSGEKLGFSTKMGLNIDNNNYIDEIRKLTELNKMVGNLRFSESDIYKLSSELTSSLDDISSLLSNEETNELGKIINSCLRNSNKSKKDNIETTSVEIQKLLNKLKMDSKTFKIYDGLDYKESITYTVAVDEIRKDLLKDLTPDYTPINRTKSEISLNNNESDLINNIEEMLANKELEQSKSVKNIGENISEIKDAMLLREKAKRIILKISNVRNELNKITEIDVSMISKYLIKLENNYKKELDKANKFIDKFNFSDVIKQIEDKKAKDSKENEKQNRMATYENLAYRLEKALEENPDDLQKINEIKAAMQDFVRKYDISENELNIAKNNGKAKYQNEAKAQKAKVESAKAKIEYEDELRKTVMAEIREEAIRELESSKAFEDNFYEARNGDVYAQPIDKEAMIQRKIAELMKLADMTPIERGLYELKKAGVVKNDATVDDLTPNQLNDIRVGYSDNAYSFMADYKDWKKRESMKPKANTIYKDYIKYRAGLSDKSEFLSFENYAKQVHNLENMSEIMVDESLKEEMRDALQAQQGGRSR